MIKGEMKGPLSGVRVLAVEHAQAGPYGSMLLGDLGAEVIKIESPEGDMSRTFAGPQHKGETYYFMAFNRSKKSLVLDLGTETGKEVFCDLVKISDVVWDNFRAGVMERLGLDYESLKKIKPSIICCSITGYGSSGPYRERPSFDIVAQALSGIMSITGEPDGAPLKTGIAVADLSGGFFGALGVAAALAKRAVTGEGQKVEISLLNTCISLLAYHLSYYFCSGDVPKRLGSGHLSVIPFGAYETKEGHIALGICWPRVARTIGAEWMIDDPRFSTQEERWKHRQEFEEIFREHFSKATAEDWEELFKVDDIPGGPVNTLDKAAIDPQVLHNKMVLNLKHPLGGEIKLAGNPVKMPGCIDEEYSPPPTLGQHSAEILSQLLGYSEEKIRKLREEQEKHIEELKAHVHKQL